jgi:hypothetical protein
MANMRPITPSALPGWCRVVEIQQQRSLTPQYSPHPKGATFQILNAGYFWSHPASRIPASAAF